MGIKFRFRRHKCTGRYRDKPVVELRWTTEEGDYCLDELIAGDLGGMHALGGNGAALPMGETTLPNIHRTIVNVDLTVPPDLDNAATINRAATRARPAPDADPDDEPGLINKIV